MEHWAPTKAEARLLEAEAKESGVRSLGMIVLAGSIVAGGVAYLADEQRSSGTKPAAKSGSSAAIAGLHGAASLLALSVFADSAIEHSRGRYRNPGMYAPVLISGLVVGANATAMFGGHGSGARDVLHGTSVALGLAGVGFHAWNVLHRPAGVCWHNLFYAAPVGAPSALALAGIIGAAADHVRVLPGEPATLAGLPAGRALSGLIAAGLVGTVAEVGLLHFRGAFNSPYMFLPVTLPPVAAWLLARAAIRPPDGNLFVTKTMLGVTAAVGLAGAFFHARGISRMMGGWRNWSQNLTDGPPVPAPPSFSALAIAGLAALALLEAADG